MVNLKNIDKQIYETYYNAKNKKALPIAIFFSVIFLIFKDVIILEIIVWGIYISYCNNNNQKLRSNKDVIARRNLLLETRRLLIERSEVK